MTDTYQDPFTDKRLEDLLAQVTKLDYPGDASTWLDQDPEVAWRSDPKDSGIAKQAVILQDAGWEGCYHRDAHLHFNVKVGGMGSWRGFHDTLNAANLPDAANTRINARGDQIQTFELEIWWQDELNDFIRYDLKKTNAKAWGCGRSGGYVNCKDLELDGESMIRLAQFLARTKAGYNSREYGEDLAERAIEEDKEQQMAELASPRIERIEA